MYTITCAGQRLGELKNCSDAMVAARNHSSACIGAVRVTGPAGYHVGQFIARYQDGKLTDTGAE